MKKRLKVEPMLINIPGSEEANLRSIIDLPTMKHYEFLDELGRRVNIEDIDKSHSFYERMIEYRAKLIE